MTFCPEWLTGSPNLDTSNVLNFWVYLVVRVMLIRPLSSRPLKHAPPPVYERDLGLCSPLAYVGLIPRNCRIITFNFQSQIGLKI